MAMNKGGMPAAAMKGGKAPIGGGSPASRAGMTPIVPAMPPVMRGGKGGGKMPPPMKGKKGC